MCYIALIAVLAHAPMRPLASLHLQFFAGAVASLSPDTRAYFLTYLKEPVIVFQVFFLPAKLQRRLNTLSIVLFAPRSSPNE